MDEHGAQWSGPYGPRGPFDRSAMAGVRTNSGHARRRIEWVKSSLTCLNRPIYDREAQESYAELRMISRASRRSVEFLFDPSAIPCIKRSKLSVAS